MINRPKAFEADIAKANFFVQLIGQHVSRRPPDVPQGYARYQYEAAKREASKRNLAMLLRCRPDVDQASVVHNDRELLFKPEMLTMGFETFKAEIVRQVDRKSHLERERRRCISQADLNRFAILRWSGAENIPGD